MDTQPLTQMPFADEDFTQAERIAKALGYEQTAYTSTSALWGLFCIPENPEFAKNVGKPGGHQVHGGCIIKTKELGFLFVQDGEDRGLGFNWEEI